MKVETRVPRSPLLPPQGWAAPKARVAFPFAAAHWWGGLRTSSDPDLCQLEQNLAGGGGPRLLNKKLGKVPFFGLLLSGCVSSGKILCYAEPQVLLITTIM